MIPRVDLNTAPPVQASDARQRRAALTAGTGVTPVARGGRARACCHLAG